MAIQEKPAARGTIATVVATASITLAIGVTAAALGGYLAPVSEGEKSKPQVATEPVLVEPPPAVPSSTSNVVLVPIAPDSQRDPGAAAPAEPTREVLLAAYEPPEHGDEGDDDHREHRDREHEDDRDDDD